MYIRLRVGEAYFPDNPKGRVFNGCFPVSIPLEVVLELFPHLTPRATCLYITFLYYDGVKYEKATPTLERIRELHYPNWTQEEFDEALKELSLIVVNEKKLISLDEPVMTIKRLSELARNKGGGDYEDPEA